MEPCVLLILAVSLSPNASAAGINRSQADCINDHFEGYREAAARFDTLVAERAALIERSLTDRVDPREIAVYDKLIDAKVSTLRTYGPLLRKECEGARKDGAIDEMRHKEICRFVGEAQKCKRKPPARKAPSRRLLHSRPRGAH